VKSRRRQSEAEFQKAVIELARYRGYRVAHFRKAHTPTGWRTPVAADGAGFPDLLLAKAGRPVMFRELKTDRGTLTVQQKLWRDALLGSGADWKLWKPKNMDEIEKELT